MSITEPRRVLVTGANGFTGQYVCKELTAAGHHAVVPERPIDLLDAADLRSIFADLVFDDVIHLAAISFVGHADPAEFYRVNTIGTINLLEAIHASGRLSGRVVLASSANIYGNNPVSPINEDASPAPVNHYAASKVAMEALVRPWCARLPIVVTRPFNYTGRGQRQEFLIPKIVAHFAQSKPELELGNIDITRDFSDVRDVAAIYLRLLDAPVGTTVNICSGGGTSLRAIIEYCSRATGHRIDIRSNAGLVRSNDILTLVGSKQRLGTIVADLPRRSIEETLDWMLAA